MYNRYVPGSNGVYERKIVEDPPLRPQPPAAPPPEQQESAPTVCSSPVHTAPRQSPMANLDLGDLLLLCIVLLLLLDAQDEDMLTVIVTVVAFLFLQ